MSSRRRSGDELLRYYTVGDTRTHEKGHTEYQVTARIVLWKRYSDFKKLHSELSYIHRNLFRRLEEFPAFPKAQVFGRFEASVIEERRRCAEDMLRFTVNIPALANSPQLKDFFRGGEVMRPLEPSSGSQTERLAPPLIPVLLKTSEGVGQAPFIHPHLQEDLGVGSPTGSSIDGEDELTITELDGCQGESQLVKNQEELDLLFDSGGEEDEDATDPHLHCPLSENELAAFDPCAKKDGNAAGGSHGSDFLTLTVDTKLPSFDPPCTEQDHGMEGSLLALHLSGEEGAGQKANVQEKEYLSLAAKQIQLGLKKEAAEDFSTAFSCFQRGVDILLKGVQDDQNAVRRDAVKKKTAEYLQHAERIFNLHLKDFPS
ncbi:sorting nexin-15 isoform X2 [Latimeria chalumnae]|uniref:sorting nexin-15 isoform X2 n=1 Tax=Latimeria chalumnae TaxID=7897 RepID=UPI00313DB7EE